MVLYVEILQVSLGLGLILTWPDLSWPSTFRRTRHTSHYSSLISNQIKPNPNKTLDKNTRISTPKIKHQTTKTPHHETRGYMELVSVSFSPFLGFTLYSQNNSSQKSNTKQQKPPSRRCMYKQGQGPSTSHFLLAYYSSSCLKFPPASLSRFPIPIPIQIPMPIAKHSCTNSRTI